MTNQLKLALRGWQFLTLVLALYVGTAFRQPAYGLLVLFAALWLWTLVKLIIVQAFEMKRGPVQVSFTEPGRN